MRRSSRLHLQCELFSFSQEKIETGITDLDEQADKFAYKVAMTLGTGTGTHEVGESIYQGTSLAASTASAIVDSVTDSTHIIVKDIKGLFVAGTNVIGETSAATRALSVIVDSDNLSDNTDDNKLIQDLTNDIVDWSENNPFSKDRE